MGKVYDALQRAEAERSRRSGSVDAGSLHVDRAPEPSGGKRSRLRSWFGRGRVEPEPEGAGALNKRRIALLQPDSFVAEQFRTLRARIDALAAERPIRTIAVTSALSGEGKTTAAVNFATVTSMGLGRRVLLVDCDLRKPKVHLALGLRPEAGLAEVLRDAVPLDRAVVKVEGTNLEVLAVRGLPSNPSELLASDRMKVLVEELAREYDRVVFDTPAALALPDAKSVTELTDGLLLVVRADTTSREDVEAALDLLDRRRALGVVLNGAEVDEKYYGYA